MTRRPTNSRSISRRKRSSTRRWIGFLAPLVFVGLLVALASGGPDQEQGEVSAFTLPTTNGGAVTFDPSVPGTTLLYFSMGVGCDGCFAQIPEIESGLAERGIDFLPIMVDPTPVVAMEAERFGITTPILIDADRAVSGSFRMLGVYGHADRPSHSFALVENGSVTWLQHYAEMFVPEDVFFSSIDSA